jgi:tRNA U34 5-carboxymethylaminomethyl modifying enzyme MnmG/GidA
MTLFIMQNNFNKINKIVNFLDEDSIDIINENPKKDKNKIYNNENEIKEAIKNNFPFDILKMENDAILESKEEEVDKKTVFKTITLRQKRGRKPKNILNRKKDHSAKDPDNVIRKIQTHFIKYIIHLLNDIAFALDNSKKPLFKKLNYSEIRIVNFKTIQKFKKFKIKELFSIFSISPRYKRTLLKNGKNINEQNLDKL